MQLTSGAAAPPHTVKVSDGTDSRQYHRLTPLRMRLLAT